MKHVIVLGSGYAGLLAATWLRRSGHRITLVSPGGVFVHRIRLHEVAAGTRRHADRALRDIVDRRIEVVDGSARRVEPGRVELGDGAELCGDAIVLATGSGGATPRPGTVRIDTAESARVARREIEALRPRSRVAVVGGGHTGLETVTEIGSARPDLDIALHAAEDVTSRLDPHAGEAVRARLASLGVRVLDGRVDLAGLASLRADLVIDTTGLVAQPLARDSGLPVTEDGRVVVDATTAVRDALGLWAAGDCAAFETRPGLRRSCALSVPMAAHTVAQVLRSLTGRDPLPFRFGFAAQCLSLGRGHGLVQFVHADDSPRGVYWSGRSGAVGNEIVNRLVGVVPFRFAHQYRAPRTLEFA
ncbi:NAD(P)/FAD-dependent oxidoreductase [Pseudonocardia alni]|uniref:NAD(P)/FAD-dependent oxidoreductase n=1 Tax=Pseudonocardia alni TaxID=33907 RepID=UPI00247AA948|nr:FAD-dependent oxidoreductase [Pseudonocardia alni]WFG47220.1 FAD-dependent oxidoreductase [Pseudonocardia alni]